MTTAPSEYIRPGQKLPFLRRVRHHFHEILLTSPSLVWMFVFFILPTIIVFLLTFRPTTITGGIGEGWTLKTWSTISNPNYPAIVWRTIWLSFVATFLCIAISLPCAFALARTSNRWRSILVGLVILPFWTSFLIRVFAWRILLHPEGWVSKVLHQTYSIFGWQFSFLEPETQLLYNVFAVLLVMVYTYLPFAILPLYAAAEKFDFNLIEAGLDLGAKPLHVFLHIFIPGIRAGIFSAVMMVLIPSLDRLEDLSAGRSGPQSAACLGAFRAPDARRAPAARHWLAHLPQASYRCRGYRCGGGAGRAAEGAELR